MNFDFTGISLTASSTEERKAASILADEIFSRTGIFPDIHDCCDRLPCIIFKTDSLQTDRDCFSVVQNNGCLTVAAAGIRGFIYGIGLFLRKTVYKDSTVELICDISGTYSPDKAIRGHQTGYRPTPNTYDAWTTAQFLRYYIEMMYFGINTVEHMPYEKGVPKRNELMMYDEEDFLTKTSLDANEIDLNISIWYPNSEDDCDSAVKNRAYLFEKTPRIDFVFPPGGDPGELAPKELFARAELFDKELKQYHPNAGIWPSAQQPHNFPNWGEEFISEISKAPEYIDGIITGPNHAYRLEELRRKTPLRYPIRFYPDITHNLRCEYPVHFDRDNWNYALSTVNSRESINPRPCEYRDLHKLTRPYVIGSVSYSEGVSDDINKAVWSALDFDPELTVREILEDYSRVYFPGCDTQKATDGIFGLEKNWEGAPEENPQIEATLKIWQELGREKPELSQNWRYVSCLFRAECDAFVRRKVIFENSLIREAKKNISAGRLDAAKNILSTPLSEDITSLRRNMDENADKLFELIGLQLSTAKHHALSWERGAVLDTADLPVTDRPWLLSRFEKTRGMADDDARDFMLRAIKRNCVEPDEYYYSVTLDGFLQTGVAQEPDFYMDFQGDRPNKNNGNMPVCLQKFYDHFSFKAKIGGLTASCDYILTVTYNDSPYKNTKEHRVQINGHTVWHGEQYGGERDFEFERDMLPEGYSAVKYRIPNGYLVNGCAELLITEPERGFEIAEFRITKAEKGN